jgi:DNA-binding beta-propeller fold protein YncE
VRGHYLALDSANNLYVILSQKINVYKSGEKKAFKVISDGVSEAGALLTDSSGNLYVANQYSQDGCGAVTVYSVTNDSLEYSIDRANGICEAHAMAIGGDGNLYVLNNNGQEFSVTVYQLGEIALLRTISPGFINPQP